MCARGWIVAATLFAGFVQVSPARAPSMDGFWRSQGYGLLFEIRGGTLSAFEVTRRTCVASFVGTFEATAAPGREATLRGPNGLELFVRPGGTADHKQLHGDGSASDMRIDRIAQRPAPTPDTPMGNFDVFSSTWAEHYISFELKQVDWGRIVEANRPKITPATTPTELFDVFESMIGPLNDAHTSIRAPELKRRFGRLRPGTDRLLKQGGAEFRKTRLPVLLGLIDRTYVKEPLRTVCNGQIQYGHLAATIGYLRILSFNGYTADGDFASGLKALDAALDDIFADRALQGLVIDVRVNFGGFDPWGLAIASRLAAREYLAYTKEARNDQAGGAAWTPGDPSRVLPGVRPGFRGPVVELIGPLTISAGETFTQALMGRVPHVVRVGENTQGVFSDVLGRGLPNGWRFGLPNEVFRTESGATFDGPGIPPDVSVPVFADEDVASGRDPGLAKALEILAPARGFAAPASGATGGWSPRRW